MQFADLWSPKESSRGDGSKLGNNIVSKRSTIIMRSACLEWAMLCASDSRAYGAGVKRSWSCGQPETERVRHELNMLDEIAPYHITYARGKCVGHGAVWSALVHNDIHDIQTLGFASHVSSSESSQDRFQNGPSSSESAAHSKTLISTRASQSFTGWYSTSIDPASLCAASLSCVDVTLETLSAKPLASKARQDEAFVTSAHSI